MDTTLEAAVARLGEPIPEAANWRLFIYVQAFLAIATIMSVIGFYAYFRWVPESLTTMASMAFGLYFGKATSARTVQAK